jgi:hypothetical protein
MLRLYPIPGQQLVEFGGRMIGDAAEHVGEPCFRIDAAPLISRSTAKISSMRRTASIASGTCLRSAST